MSYYSTVKICLDRDATERFEELLRSDDKVLRVFQMNAARTDHHGGARIFLDSVKWYPEKFPGVRRTMAFLESLPERQWYFHETGEDGEEWHKGKLFEDPAAGIPNPIEKAVSLMVRDSGSEFVADFLEKEVARMRAKPVGKPGPRP